MEGALTQQALFERVAILPRTSGTMQWCAARFREEMLEFLKKSGSRFMMTGPVTGRVREETPGSIRDPNMTMNPCVLLDHSSPDCDLGHAAS